MADELQTALEKLTNQARFIQMIVDKQLVVSNRKKIDIVTELRKNDFRPFPKVSLAKKAGENEAANDDDDDDNDANDAMDVDSKGKGKGKEEAGDYDYLLGMPIWSLTREKIEKLRTQADDRERELLILLEKTPKSMWNADLDEFVAEWNVGCSSPCAGIMINNSFCRRTA